MLVTTAPSRPSSRPAANDAPYPTREPSEEMAFMLESMKAAEERMALCKDNLQLAVQSDLVLYNYAGASRGISMAEALSHNSYRTAPPAPPQQDEIPHEDHDHKGHHLLGGHLGLESGHLLTKYVAEARAGLMAIKTNANQAASDGLDTAINRVGHGICSNAELAHGGMSTGLQAATAAVGAASGVLGVMLLKVGVKDMIHGIRHKETEHAIEGASAAIVGTRSIAAGISTAGHLIHCNSYVAQAAGIATSTLTPLGVIHGAIDTGLGLKDVIQGLRHDDSCQIGKGVLSIGLGSALIASALGGGLPAILLAGSFLVGKIVNSVCHGEHTESHESEAEPAEAAQPRSHPVPPQNDGHH